jgi:hypothetical protein
MAATHAARITRLENNLSSLESKIDRLLAVVDADAPAKTAPKGKTQPKADAKPRKALTKAQKRAWNTKITSLAAHGRKAGTCKALMARWAEAGTLRDAGVTPAKALTRMGL